MGTFPDYIVFVYKDEVEEDLCFKHAVRAAQAGKEIEAVMTEDYFRARICQRCIDERENGELWNPLEG